MEPQQVSISEAAKLTGRSRRSLYRDIASGRLSVTTTHTGAHDVSIPELLRVYGAFKGDAVTVHRDNSVPMAHRVTADGTAQQVRMAVLEAENVQLRERLSDRDKNLDDLRSTIKLLEYKMAGPRKPGFWGRIFGVRI